MAVSYKRLFKILIDRDMKKKDFIELAGISFSTMSKLNHGENVTTEVLVKICRALDCTLDDIMEILPDEETEQTSAETEQRNVKSKSI